MYGKLVNANGKKGRNDAVTTARVDIIFDNTDERFPVWMKQFGKIQIESDEVTIRRTISGSTDSFYVNNRLYTKVSIGGI